MTFEYFCTDGGNFNNASPINNPQIPATIRSPPIAIAILFSSLVVSSSVSITYIIENKPNNT